MTDKLSLFGSYGLQTEPRVFGRRAAAAPAPTREGTPVFGKRQRPPALNVSLQRARLSHLRSELLNLFEDGAIAGQAPDFVLAEAAQTLCLLIGRRALVSVDSETGRLVFVETNGSSDTTVITASDERLIDHVMCHLAGEAAADTPQTASKAARMLVGQTLEEIERHAILQTLRHCQGNRTRTARMLGISLRTIRNKLRAYWMDRSDEDESAPAQRVDSPSNSH